MKYLLFVFLAVVLVACGRDLHTHYVPGPVVEVPAEPIPLTDVEQIVADKNVFRIASGQLPLTRGLTCTLHNSSNPDLSVALPSASHTFTMLGEFNQPNSSVNSRLNVIPVNLRPLYLNNYVLKCVGQIVITESGYYSMELSSDDGSRLFIDNALVVDNNFNHGVVKIIGSKLLERGVHSFTLIYGQTGSGNQALILESSGVVVPAENFYR